ncbi:hypothetical protein VNO80_14850 [Phaseolus coccineus]|uniref:Uncharacterized protein n=1 Tax=Phaseolus coccineus TaxID=3886 RepID=A0AAN9MIR0_PHACN
MPRDFLRFAPRLFVLCSETSLPLAQDFLAFVPTHLRLCPETSWLCPETSWLCPETSWLCPKTSCTLPDLALCLKTSCALSQDFLRFVSRLFTLFPETSWALP